MFLFGLVAQLVRAPPCHGGGRRFESDLGREILKNFSEKVETLSRRRVKKFLSLRIFSEIA